jgi:hypothetical protein
VPTDQKSHSRREFARRAALLSIGAPLAAATPVSGTSFPSISDDQQLPKLPPNFPKLSDQSRAEVEARYESIVKQYSGRFNEQQKAELRRLCFLAQPPLDSLRAYQIHNSDSPNLYLKPVVEREKKPPKSTPAPSAAAAKKP